MALCLGPHYLHIFGACQHSQGFLRSTPSIIEPMDEHYDFSSAGKSQCMHYYLDN